MRILQSLLATTAVIALVTGLQAQTTETEVAASSETVEAAEALLTQAELETLVAPVALYPDTLLMQILVASTEPLDLVKADNFLDENADRDPADLKVDIEAQAWDPSVQVLATAFPDVVDDMAAHIDWTETMGDAMLAQSDGVLDAIQTMRQAAINNGALVSGKEQTVEVTRDETTQAEAVVIQPANPEVVYVPQYDQNTVFDDVGNVLLTGAIIWGSVALIDEIFDDDDDWNDYWGCRNCGGWNGQPIIRNPDVDIDLNGNVNIGNNVNIDRDKVVWKPDNSKQIVARDRITKDRDPGGKTKLPINKNPSRQDDLRQSLSDRAGTKDISRRDGGAAAVNRPSQFTPNDKAAAVRKTKTKGNATRSPGVDRPSANKPVATRPSAKQRPATSAAKRPNKSALKVEAPATRTKAGANRGKTSSAKLPRRK